MHSLSEQFDVVEQLFPYQNNIAKNDVKMTRDIYQENARWKLCLIMGDFLQFKEKHKRPR